MKKLIIGLTAIGGIVAFRSLAGQRGQKMREHCKEMMASHSRASEEALTLERSGQEVPQSVANGDAVRL